MAEIVFFEHPDYSENVDAWERYHILYDGDHSELIRPKYLWLHEFEHNTSKGGDILRSIREKRTIYENFIEVIVQAYINLVFTNDVDTSELEGIFTEEEFYDVDGKGTSFDAFIRDEIAKSYFVYGRPYTLVDSAGIKAQSRGTEKALGLRPYISLLPTLQVKDWAIEHEDPRRIGQLNFLRYEYVLIEARQSPLEPPVQRMYSTVYSIVEGRYYIEHFKGKRLDKEEKKPDGSDAPKWISMGVNPVPELDRIPIAFTLGNSWIAKISPVAMLRHNTQSSLDNILLNQAFQRIIVSGEHKPKDGMVLNEAGVTFVPPESQVNVIEPCDPVALDRRLNQLTQRMFQIGFWQTRAVPSDSKETESADAQQEGKKLLLEAMKKAARKIEEITNQTVQNWAAFKSKKQFDGKVVFNLELSETDADRIVQTAAAHWDEIVKYPEWRKQTNIKIASNMELGETDAVQAEIEAGAKETAGPTLRTDRLRAALEAA